MNNRPEDFRLISWIKANLERGCGSEWICAFLHNNGYSLEVITNTMNAAMPGVHSQALEIAAPADYGKLATVRIIKGAGRMVLVRCFTECLHVLA